MVASMRFGSFSPPTPVSTVRVTRRPGNAGGRAGDDEFDAAAGRDSDVILPADEISGGSVGVERNAVERDDAELLRRVFIEDCEIEVGDR